MQQKIVLIGGPGTGKTSVLNELITRGYPCKIEVSRAVTLEAQKKGVAQLFLKEPLLFSEKLLAGREQQFLEAHKTKEKLIFFDRGIPDIHAYLDYFNTEYPQYFLEKSHRYKYDKIFLFSPWKTIYSSDNERYETFKEAKLIDEFIRKGYEKIGYEMIKVPFDTIQNRTDFILNTLQLKS